MKKTLFMLLAASFAVSLYGCANKHVKTISDVVDNVKIAQDPHAKTTTQVITFPEFSYSNIPYKERVERVPEYSLTWLDAENLKYFIEARVSREFKEPQYQIHVSMKDKKFLYLRAVYELDGTPVTNVEIKRELKKGPYNDATNEIIIINVTEKYIRDNVKSGIAFKITGQDGNKYFHIPSYYLEGVLVFMHQYKTP